MSWDKFSVEGIGERHVSMEASGTITAGTHEGLCCSLAGNLQVKVGAANDVLFGVISKIAGDEITVQDAGYVTVTYTGSAPSVGIQNLECGADGKVQVDASNGHPYKVVAVDTTATTVTFLLG